MTASLIAIFLFSPRLKAALLQKTPCPPVGPLQLQLFDVPCCDSLVDLLAALEAGGGIEVLQEVE